MLYKFKKFYQETSLEVTDPVANIFSGLISNTSEVDGGDACNNLTLDNIIYIEQQATGFISPGDIVYLDALGTSPFNGDSNFYKIKASNSNTYTAQIDGSGVILTSPGFGICV